MNVFCPFFWRKVSFAGMQSEHGFKTLADNKSICDQIPIPETFVGAFQYALQLVLRVLKSFQSCTGGVVFSFEFSDALFEFGN